MSFSLEWVGHSCFLIKTPECTIIIDPFLDSNPKSLKTVETVGHIDLILITHGHFDHISEALPLAVKTGATLVCTPELAFLLKRLNPHVSIVAMGIGGNLDPKKIWNYNNISSITMVSALHSSSFEMDGIKHYAGIAAGFLITLHIGEKFLRLYHAGDTALHINMKLLQGTTDIAMLPIDGRYNMTWEDAKTLEHWINPKIIIPMHYDTFPEIRLNSSTISDLNSHPSVHLFDKDHHFMNLLQL